MKCTCSVYANEPSRWCEKHVRLSDTSGYIAAMRVFWGLQPKFEEYDLGLVEIWPDVACPQKDRP